MLDTEKPVFFYVGVLHKPAGSGEVTAATRGGGEVTLVPLGTCTHPPGGEPRAPGPNEHLPLGEPIRHRGLREERGEKSRTASPPLSLLLLILGRNFIFLSPFPMQK